MILQYGQYYNYKGDDFPHERVLYAGNSPFSSGAVVLRSNGENWTILDKHLYEISDASTADMLLPTNPQERKNIPITTGFLDYFPLAVAEVAKCSKAGNDQHHPGEPLFWDKTKSTDHADCIARHLVDRGKFDTDGQRHSAKLAWRALALLQLELENEKEKP